MNDINPNTIINPLADEISALEAQIGKIDISQLDPKDNGKVLSPAVDTKQPVNTPAPAINTAPVVETPSSQDVADPIKTELERIKGQTQGKTPQEKFAYKLKLEAQRAKEMGLDVNEILGIPKQEENEEEEDRPLTRKDLESILSSVKPKTQTATDLAMQIENEAERELHLHYLENVIRPSGDAQADFQNAKTMVDAVKLKQSAIFNNLKPEARNYSTASSYQPNKSANVDNIQLTPLEEMLYRDAQVRGIKLTKEEILSTRK